MRLTVQQLTRQQATSIVIIQQPENGKLVDNKDGTFTYTPSSEKADEFVADSFVYVYKDVSGELIEGKREFVVTQEGDVPSLIQTGGSFPNNSKKGNLLYFFAFLVLAFTFTRAFQKSRIRRVW